MTKKTEKNINHFFAEPWSDSGSGAYFRETEG